MKTKMSSQLMFVVVVITCFISVTSSQTINVSNRAELVRALNGTKGDVTIQLSAGHYPSNYQIRNAKNVRIVGQAGVKVDTIQMTESTDVDIEGIGEMSTVHISDCHNVKLGGSTESIKSVSIYKSEDVQLNDVRDVQSASISFSKSVSVTNLGSVGTFNVANSNGASISNIGTLRVANIANTKGVRIESVENFELLNISNSEEVEVKNAKPKGDHVAECINCQV